MPHIPPPSSLSPGSTVDAYLRDSGGLKQDRSVTRQLEALTEFCAQYNFILRTPYQDVAKSGATTAGRENFLRMVADFEIPANRPRALLIWNYARFARDVDDSQLYKALIRKWGVLIHSLTDDIPEGRYGRLIEMLIEISNEEKAEQTAQDAADGLRSIVQQGAMPGIPPRGFKREPMLTTNYRTGEQRTNHRWVPDPDLAPRIRQAFTMKAAGGTLVQIHDQTRLYNSLNSYRTFFENRLYIGILDFGDRTFEHYCDPIVDLATWDAVQKILTLHADHQAVRSSEHHPRRRAEPATYQLSGLAFCARCGSPLYGMTSRQRNGLNYLRYACTRRHRRRDCDLQPIPAKPLEKEVIQKLAAFFDDPANLQSLIEDDLREKAELASNSTARAKELQKQLNTLRRSLANLTNAIAERGHSKSMLAKHAELERQETLLQSQLHLVKAEIPMASPPLTTRQIAALSGRVLARLQSPDSATVRKILHGLVHKITIDRTEKNVIGVLKINTPREPQTPEQTEDPPPAPSPALTASTSPPPVGAPLHKRSIPFSFTVRPPGKHPDH